MQFFAVHEATYDFCGDYGRMRAHCVWKRSAFFSTYDFQRNVCIYSHVILYSFRNTPLHFCVNLWYTQCTQYNDRPS